MWYFLDATLIRAMSGAFQSVADLFTLEFKSVKGETNMRSAQEIASKHQFVAFSSKYIYLKFACVFVCVCSIVLKKEKLEKVAHTHEHICVATYFHLAFHALKNHTAVLETT